MIQPIVQTVKSTVQQVRQVALVIPLNLDLKNGRYTPPQHSPTSTGK